MTGEKKHNKSKIFFSLVALFYLWTMGLSSIGIDPAIFLGYFYHGKVLILNLLPVLFASLFFFSLWKNYSLGFFFSFAFFSLIGIGHSLKMVFRGEGLKITDYELIIPGLRILPHYLSPKIIPFLALVIFLFYIGIRGAHRLKVYKISPLERLVGLILALVFFLFIVPRTYYSKDLYLSFQAHKDLDILLEEEAYMGHGLPYSLLYGSQDLEINRYYQPQEARNRLKDYTQGTIAQGRKVNIVLYQLEGFKDFRSFIEAPLLVNPYVYWDQIGAQSLQGNLIVDVYGGGTIDTEVKVASGSQEFPKFDEPIESLARFLGQEGYYSLFAHANTGKFYNREKIYGEMDYDALFFQDIKEGYMKEEEVISRVRRKVEGKEGPVFAHIVGIQNHGPFERDRLLGPEYIANRGPDSIQVNNYFYGLEDSSKALADYIRNIEGKKTPYVVIAYGDHSPKFSEENYRSLGVRENLPEIEKLRLRFETPFIVYGNQAARQRLGQDFRGRVESMGPGFLVPFALDYMGYKGTRGMAYMEDFRKNHMSYVGEFYLIDKDGFRLRKTEDKALLREFSNINIHRSKISFENQK